MRIEISDKEILSCTCAKVAMKMSLDYSGRSNKAVAIDLGLTEGHLSRALNPMYDVNLKHDLIVPFMVSCGNDIYLRWQSLRLKELLPELERHNRPGDLELINSEIEELKLVLRQSIDEIKKARPAKSCDCGAKFALSPGVGSIPKWMVEMAIWIEWEMGGIL